MLETAPPAPTEPAVWPPERRDGQGPLASVLVWLWELWGVCLGALQLPQGFQWPPAS